MHQLLVSWQGTLWAAGIILVALVLAFALHSILFALAGKFAKRTHSVLNNSIVQHGRRPAQLIFPLIALLVVLPTLRLSPGTTSAVRHIISLAVIASAAWLVVTMMDVIEDLAEAKFPVEVRDNLKARKIQTQIQVVRRIVVVLVVIVAVSAALMTFPEIRAIGTSLLASAGLAGLVVGLAARPALANLIAGMQIALSEPIRLDDVVIVEGEWGWIEEIGTTYVVVRIWDLRRLVVPLSYFIEKPFQNWTRQTAALLGTVFVYTDYSVPTEKIRQQLHEILQASGMWDGKAWALEVTNASERTMELRALMSAPDSSQAWNLRCYVREKLIAYLQREYPTSLPKIRAELESSPQIARA